MASAHSPPIICCAFWSSRQATRRHGQPAGADRLAHRPGIRHHSAPRRTGDHLLRQHSRRDSHGDRLRRLVPRRSPAGEGGDARSQRGCAAIVNRPAVKSNGSRSRPISRGLSFHLKPIPSPPESKVDWPAAWPWPCSHAFTVFSNREAFGIPSICSQRRFTPNRSSSARRSLNAFHLDSFFLAVVIHVTTSLLVGLLYGAMLPMFPRRPILLGGVIAPVFWTGLIHSLLGLVDPLLNERIDWWWFAASQFAFGIVAGLVVMRQEHVRTRQFVPFLVRAGMEAPGMMGEKPRKDQSQMSAPARSPPIGCFVSSQSSGLCALAFSGCARRAGPPARGRRAHRSQPDFRFRSFSITRTAPAATAPMEKAAPPSLSPIPCIWPSRTTTSSAARRRMEYRARPCPPLPKVRAACSPTNRST